MNNGFGHGEKDKSPEATFDGCLVSTPEMGVQQQQAGNNGQNRVTEKVDGMGHFFTIALDQGL